VPPAQEEDPFLKFKGIMAGAMPILSGVLLYMVAYCLAWVRVYYRANRRSTLFRQFAIRRHPGDPNYVWNHKRYLIRFRRFSQILQFTTSAGPRSLFFLPFFPI
jgi:hypothetical protein